MQTRIWSNTWKNLNSSELNDYITQNRIQWKFIVECAPFWGGFYGRMVKCVKIPLRKTLRNVRVTSGELNTILIEIESILNDRPLTYIYSSSEEIEPLTTSQFLARRRLDTIPPVYYPIEGKIAWRSDINFWKKLRTSFGIYGEKIIYRS